MLENLFRSSKIGVIRFWTNIPRWARATREWYRQLGCTESELRGIQLLREWLSPEQLVQFRKYRYFDVTGCQSGKKYRICYGTATNIWELDRHGHPKAGWCFVPNEPLVPGDVMLAQKISLETNEWSALAVAKPFGLHWHRHR